MHICHKYTLMHEVSVGEQVQAEVDDAEKERSASLDS